MCGCLSCIPYWGPGLQPRRVPWLGIEPATLWFTGTCSIHWATPAGQCWFLISSHCKEHSLYDFNLSNFTEARLFYDLAYGNAWEHFTSTWEEWVFCCRWAGCSVSVRSTWLTAFKPPISVSILCLPVLPSTESGTLTSPTIIVELCVSPLLLDFAACTLRARC